MRETLEAFQSMTISRKYAHVIVPKFHSLEYCCSKEFLVFSPTRLHETNALFNIFSLSSNKFIPSKRNSVVVIHRKKCERNEEERNNVSAREGPIQQVLYVK